jgi:glycosyl transferase family 25
MDIPVFVINLKRSQDRRDHTTKRLNDLGVPFKLIEAYNGTELSDHEIMSNPDFGIYKRRLYSRYLLKEEIGCTLSHLKIYKQMIDEKISLACIVEDDLDYLTDFKDLVLNTDLNISDWDILYLGHHSGSVTNAAKCKKQKQLKPHFYWIGEAIDAPFGSYAYIINIKAVEKLINHAFPIRIPFDRYIHMAPKIGIRTFLLSPPCVFHNSFFISTINYNPKISYPTLFWKFAGEFMWEIYSWFPFVRKIRKWF